MKHLVVALLAFLSPAVPALAAVEEPAKILEQPLPAYPANTVDLEGAVLVEFSITIDGMVRDAKVVEATLPGVFDDAALAAVYQWRYAPKTVDGNPVEQTATRMRLRFKPDTSQPAVIRQGFVEYPREAFDAKREGSVRLQFDVNQYGLVENVRVLASLADSTFDQAAVKAMSDALYRPALVDGKPVATRGLTTTVNFSLADAHFKPKLKPHSFRPDYPEKARHEGVEGYCLVRMALRDDGTVEKSEIVNTYPARYFAPTCLEASQRLVYYPPGDDPSGRTVHFAELFYRFGLEDFYAPAKVDQRKKWAKFRYTLTATGGTADITLLENSSNADTEWTRSALQQLRQTRFAPHRENGTAIDYPNQIAVIRGPSD